MVVSNFWKILSSILQLTLPLKATVHQTTSPQFTIEAIGLHTTEDLMNDDRCKQTEIHVIKGGKTMKQFLAQRKGLSVEGA